LAQRGAGASWVRRGVSSRPHRNSSASTSREVDCPGEYSCPKTAVKRRGRGRLAAGREQKADVRAEGRDLGCPIGTRALGEEAPQRTHMAREGVGGRNRQGQDNEVLSSRPRSGGNRSDRTCRCQLIPGGVRHDRAQRRPEKLPHGIPRPRSPCAFSDHVIKFFIPMVSTYGGTQCHPK